MRIWEWKNIICLGLSLCRGVEKWLRSQALEADSWAHNLVLLFPTCATLSKLLEFLVHQFFFIYTVKTMNCVFSKGCCGI